MEISAPNDMPGAESEWVEASPTDCAAVARQRIDWVKSGPHCRDAALTFAAPSLNADCPNGLRRPWPGACRRTA